ncbi:MAG: hypothetical protein WAM96_07735 [Candidatus Acidiferrales bacterium]
MNKTKVTLPAIWTAAEEKAYDELMKAGNLDRLEAIRLFRR